MTTPPSPSRSGNSVSDSSSDRHVSSSPGGFSPQRSPVLKAFLFGHPISHSLAPLMHHTLWNSTKPEPIQAPEARSNFQFTLLDTLSTEHCLATLADPDCVGCSITMPHKLTLINQVDELTEEARIIGAINTIYIRKDLTTEDRSGNGNRFIGTNTDCIGIRDAFLRSFTDTRSMISFNEKVRGRTALIIGAGGATRAAIYALWKFFDIKLVYLINRFEHEAEEVMRSMSGNGCTVEMKYINSVQEVGVLGSESPVMVVVTVPDIPARTEEELRAMEVVEETLRSRKGASEGWLLDMCYHPNPTTTLMKLAKEQDWHTVSGVEALKYQGIRQFELWSGREVDEKAIGQLSRVIDDAVRRRVH